MSDYIRPGRYVHHGKGPGRGAFNSKRFSSNPALFLSPVSTVISTSNLQLLTILESSTVQQSYKIVHVISAWCQLATGRHVADLADDTLPVPARPLLRHYSLP